MKKIYILTFLLLFTFTPTVLAHSNLESSIPHDGEVITENLSTLTLTFNTVIEVTSSFKLTNESGQDIPLESILVNNKDMIGNLSSPLEDGKYIVKWKIIGGDGHPIENSYSFSIDTSGGNNATEVSSEPVIEEKNIEYDHDNIENIEKEAPTSNNFLVVSAILLIIVALGTSFWLLKRGKK